MVGLLAGIIGDAVGTAALLVLHPEWLFGDGESIVTIAAGLVPGWTVALVVAVIASLVLVTVGSKFPGDAPASRSFERFIVVLLFAVPAAIAAGTLWWLASVNR